MTRAHWRPLTACRALFSEKVAGQGGGRVVNAPGDSILAEFASVVKAVECALEIQRAIADRNAPLPENQRMRFRIGVNLGDVLVDAAGIYGDGVVNIAARLESLANTGRHLRIEAGARPGEKSVRLSFEDLGDLTVKNIAEPVRVFRIMLEAGTAKTKPAVGEIDLSLPDKPSIAVLPFINMSGDPEQEYFTDGVTEDIITELSRFHSLFVIARNSTFTYKGKATDVRTVARELGVRFVLEGSIRRAGDRIRVTAQLIDALTGNHIWAERYDRVLEDIFAVQEEVTQAIVAAIAPQIDAAELAKARRPRPGNLSAYEIAVRAWADALEAFGKADGSLCDQAIREAKEALAIDSGSVLALNALAFSRLQQCVVLRTAANLDDAWEEGMAACTRAIELDRSDHRPLVWKGLLLLYETGDVRWEEALMNLRRACELNSNDCRALRGLGYGEALSGNPQQAIHCLTQALRISPRDPLTYITHLTLAVACFGARDYEKSLHWASLAIRDAPNYPQAHLHVALACVGLADIEKAKAALDRTRRIAPEFVQSRLEGYTPRRKPEDRQHFTVFLRIAAGLEEPGAADKFR